MPNLPRLYFTAAGLLLTAQLATQAEQTISPVSECVVFEEIDGLVAVEAEHYFKQESTNVRQWYPVALGRIPQVSPDGDRPHLEDASGAAYLEILPDTRRSHGDPLLRGENFSNLPNPAMAVLSYKVHINNPGRYYVWARIYSTNTEDNGLHVGLDGTWPASGSRMQWTAKHQWYWDSRQRTEENHTGERYKLYLDINEPGEHTVQFAMREDGTEFDKWLMTTDREFERPLDKGPESKLYAGELPEYQPIPVYNSIEGTGAVTLHGELRQWHNVILDLDGPGAQETCPEQNPFTDYRMTVTFRHESGRPVYQVPGYFAADGNAAESSADKGTVWRAHLRPDKSGKWTYTIHFAKGPLAAIDPAVGLPLDRYDGLTGSFTIEETDKDAPDFRARGRLEYVGERYLRFRGDNSYFLKAGPDAPETLLAYADFDNTRTRNEKRGPLKTWAPHIADWREGDPVWKGDKGKGLVGALNYLAGKGLNSVSFLPYNAGGDGDNVWPFVEATDKLHYDVSKLDQWGIVFEHAQNLGLYLHFKLQETEMDDDRTRATMRDGGTIPESLDGGKLGIERKLYLRELIARFGHNLALNWNLGEENTQTYEEQRDMAAYIRNLDPYDHHVVIHTYPEQQDDIYPHLLGSQSVLTGASLQNSWSAVHQLTLKWIQAAELAGKPWVVANDEQNPAQGGVPPDPGFRDFDGIAEHGTDTYTIDDIRKYTLWGNLMAGGAGVEYYFGYKYAESDLYCEDFRSRDQSWDYCRIALDFFRDVEIPFWNMGSRDDLVGNPESSNARFCLAQPGRIYMVYLPEGGQARLDLTGVDEKFRVRWFNPRTGGELLKGSVSSIKGGDVVDLGEAPAEPEQDWLVLVQ